MGGVELKALDEVSVSIEAGTFAAVMGPSGSGKSTLLNILGCLDKPSAGSYILDGKDVSKLDDDELSAVRGLKIGFIFQSYNLIAQLNVLENIEIPMFYQGLDEQACRTRATELAEMVGLGERLRHRPFELSGGQQQRVAIARALSNDPVIILADEPTGNLDSASGEEIMSILENLNKQGRTLIMVTHDSNIAGRAKRVIHLKDGGIDRDVMN